MSEPLESYKWIGCVPNGSYVVQGHTHVRGVLYVTLVGESVEDTFRCTRDSAGTEIVELQAPETFAFERGYSVRLKVSLLNEDIVKVEFELDQITLTDYRDWVKRGELVPVA